MKALFVILVSISVWLSIQMAMAVEPSGHLQAFVVGNGEYEGMARVPSAIEDAKRVARLLKRAGFDFPQATDMESGATLNCSRQQLCTMLQDLRSGNKVKNAHLMVFYYSGHGGQVKKDAFVLGVDSLIAESGQASDLRKQGLNLQDIIADLKPHDGIGLIAVVDACLCGAADKETPAYEDDVLAAFATSATKKAAEGLNGQPSVFTTTLMDALQSQMSFGDALKKAYDASILAGNTPMAKYSPTSPLARFRLPPLQSADLVPREEPAPVSSPIPSLPSTEVTPAWLYLTANVKTGLTLRPTRGTIESGEIVQKSNDDAVAVCYPERIVEERGTRWIPVKCEGWVLSKNLGTGKSFLEKRGAAFKVLSEIVKVRTVPELVGETTFKLEPNAQGILVDEVTVADGYEWQRILYQGWVALVGPSGKEYATFKMHSSY